MIHEERLDSEGNSDNRHPWAPKMFLHTETLWQDCGLYMKDDEDYVDMPYLCEYRMTQEVDNFLYRVIGKEEMQYYDTH